MKNIKFHKYQATGNDFVMIDNRDGVYDNLSLTQIQSLCDRRFGIGADGLIKINSHPNLDFEVDYYNADGTKSFCGNGARCAVLFVKSIGIDVSNSNFSAIDGSHQATLDSDKLVHLAMNNVNEIINQNADYVLFTGSPHFIRFVDDLEQIDIVELGKEIRFSQPFKKEGINVNAVQKLNSSTISILTYERGVEDETYSCGTGATAAAIALAEKEALAGEQEIKIIVKGGELKVSFKANADGSFENVKLIGKANFVFEGEINV